MRLSAIHFEALAADLQQRMHSGLRRVVVTSTGPGEGKSTITAQLGEAMANIARTNVLVIDTDYFRPTLHTLCGVDNRRGLGEMLREIYALDPRKESPSQFGLGDWVELLGAQSRTGTLRVKEDKDEFSVMFDRGMITGVRTHSKTADLRLGHLLLRDGFITEAQRETALRVHQQAGAPLGEVCCGLGYLEPSELVVSLTAQLRGGLERMMTLRNPLCSFAETADPYVAASVGKQVESAAAGGGGSQRARRAEHAVGRGNGNGNGNGNSNGNSHTNGHGHLPVAIDEDGSGDEQLTRHENGHGGSEGHGSFDSNGNGEGAHRELPARLWKYMKRPYLSCQIPGYLKDTATENLKILTSGATEYSLMEQRTYEACRLAFDRLAPMFDLTLVDAAPVALASPAERLARDADGVLLVVKADSLDAQVIRQAKQRLERAGANILGVVLNQVDLRRTEPGHYYYGTYR